MASGGAKAAARASSRPPVGAGRENCCAGAVDRQYCQLLCGARTEDLTRPKLEVETPTGKTGLKQGARVRHPKYGEGTVFRREGDGDDAKITVQFQQHGVKKLVEKFAQLERL